MPVPSGAPPPLQHPVIGSVQGKYSKGVIQYLGIKYASLQNRLAEPNVVEYQPGSSLNAVVHGYVFSPSRYPDAYHTLHAQRRNRN